jgi:hypothetical protein
MLSISFHFFVTKPFLESEKSPLIFTAIKNVLRQGNLNPEIEEKLLTLQRYQEKQAKGEPFDPTFEPPIYSTRAANTTRATTVGSGYDSTLDSDEFDDENSNQSFRGSAKKRGMGGEDDDDEWVLDTPRKYIKKADREKLERGKKEPNYMADVKKQINEDKATKVIVKTTDSGQIRKNIIFCNRADVSVQNNFSVVSSSGESEKSPEKALLATKLKMKAAQKLTGMTEEQVKHHKLQVNSKDCDETRNVRFCMNQKMLNLDKD